MHSGDGPSTEPEALRDKRARIKNIDDLRRAGGLLARHLGLPHAPQISVGYVPWKGPGTPIVELMGASHGAFTVARWAVRGKYRRSWEALEYAVVCGIGFWLESQRREGVLSDAGTREALIAWYGADGSRRLVEDLERRTRLLR